MTAHVVALEQVQVYNRFGSFNPAGMMYALRRDVVVAGDDEAGSPSSALSEGMPIPLQAGSVADERALAGHVRLRSDKRPRPLVLRVNEGECLRVRFTNLLSPARDPGQEIITDPQTGNAAAVDGDEPATRRTSMHVEGLEYVDSILSDGANVGRNPSSLAAPGQTVTYTWFAEKEGSYLVFSMAAPAGGEGDGGQVGLGLFGSINVEPRGSVSYRSQVTADQMQRVTRGHSDRGTPVIDYDATDEVKLPLLAIRGPGNEIVHSDLNAVVDPRGEDCPPTTEPNSACGKPFREFTVIFHDEITAVQAYRDLENEDNPISSLKDGTAINYGSAGLGAMILANRRGEGPAKDCVECKVEEFFLTSWAMGDPAMVVRRDAGRHAIEALYPDDPSNVHHSYIGDPVRFRNLHAGPKETHVFHLHAHQWVQDRHDQNSVYLDSQTISPGASFTYQIEYGGSGNRNATPGDAIFHCHLYPHFAQGMWELWRSHDVFEAGTADRNLPDGELSGGTPNPAVIPLPRAPLAPMPTTDFKGYPFYIEAEKGHRPPQAPGDIDTVASGGVAPDALGRHIVLSGTRTIGPEVAAEDKARYFAGARGKDDPVAASVGNAVRVSTKNQSLSLLTLASHLDSIDLRRLPEDGSAKEKRAMDFHAGKGPDAVTLTGHMGIPVKGYPSCDSGGHCDNPSGPRVLFEVNGRDPKPGAPFADPCPDKYLLKPTKGESSSENKWLLVPPERAYRAAYLQLDMPVNKFGWHDPQARMIVLEQDIKSTLTYERPAEPFFFRANSGECVTFEATNLIPSNLNLDDFQVFTPTDTIGQHIHLVKFDVTASDGSGNGWNYEDGTMSPDEIRERIVAYNAHAGSVVLRPKTHRLFQPGGPLAGDARGLCPDDPQLWKDHVWCGAQSTMQRWWVDPLVNTHDEDRTLRTVFTHDHFGPSSHQHHGLYAALVVEPAGALWQTLGGETFGGQTAAGTQIVKRPDGGPTSFAANISIPPSPSNTGVPGSPSDMKRIPEQTGARREYGLAVADYAILYDRDDKPINPPARTEHALPIGVFQSSKPAPEGISTKDPGSQLMNYRNEPIPLRIGRADPSGTLRQRRPDDSREADAIAACTAGLNDPANSALFDPVRNTNCRSGDATCKAALTAQLCDPGDVANVFSGWAHQKDAVDPCFHKTRAELQASDDPRDRRCFRQYLEPTCSFGQGILCSEAQLRIAKKDNTNEVETLPLRGPGDPSTPILAAYEGDRVQLRLIQGGQEENHIFAVSGFKWKAQPGSPNSGWRAGQHIGISEHFEFDVKAENPNPRGISDHLYRTTATDNLWDGQYGLLRVLPRVPAASRSFVAAIDPADQHRAAMPLTGETPVGPPPSDGKKTCPLMAPLRVFTVQAWRARDFFTVHPERGLIYNAKAGIDDPSAIVFVKTTELVIPNDPTFADDSAAHIAAIKSRAVRIEPLILRARAGECLQVHLVNKMPVEAREDLSDPSVWSDNLLPPIANLFNFNQVRRSGAVGLQPVLAAFSSRFSDGGFVGNNAPTLAFPGRSEIVYTWYAGDYRPESTDWQAKPGTSAVEFGAIPLQNLGDVVKGPSHGTIGALVIEPAKATWQSDCVILKQAGNCLESAATVRDGKAVFRDFVTMVQDDTSLRYRGEPLPNLRSADDSEDTGQRGFNYRFEPLWARLGAAPAAPPEDMLAYDYGDVLSSWPVCSDGRKAGSCPGGAALAPGFGDPETPLFTAQAGIPVRWRVVHPGGHPRNHAFAVAGHNWIVAPYANGSAVQTPDNPDSANRFGIVNGLGPGRHENLLLRHAGGARAIAGDYLYASHEGFSFGGGQWGLMRVLGAGDGCGVGDGTAPAGPVLAPDPMNPAQRVVCR